MAKERNGLSNSGVLATGLLGLLIAANAFILGRASSSGAAAPTPAQVPTCPKWEAPDAIAFTPSPLRIENFCRGFSDDVRAFAEVTVEDVQAVQADAGISLKYHAIFKVACPRRIGAACDVTFIDLDDLEFRRHVNAQTVSPWDHFRVTSIVGPVVTVSGSETSLPAKVALTIDLGARKFRFARDFLGDAGFDTLDWSERGESDCPP
jgi:hypothetical protein